MARAKEASEGFGEGLQERLSVGPIAILRPKYGHNDHVYCTHRDMAWAGCMKTCIDVV